MANADLHAAAAQLNLPLRFYRRRSAPAAAAQPARQLSRLLLAAAPIDASLLGRPRGRLTVIGLGPGAAGIYGARRTPGAG